jgi:superfamily II DNA or RNA helicase
MSAITSLTWLKKDLKFLKVIEKMMLGENLLDDESSYILACAILLIKSYEKDKRRTTHFELGYFIIVSYSTSCGDYSPLLDISTTFGFYPISKFIIDKGLDGNTSFSKYLLEQNLEKFNYNGITETFEQQKYRNEILNNDLKESSYVAPTSFGKSSLFVEIISWIKPKRVAIIVPTKSLLTQTYRNINKRFPEKKIIFHDEMYDGEEEFIAVFTQERALRLLKNPEVSFDMLIIDEAHNLFEKSFRSVLLTRVIRRNRKRNIEAKVYYFSPLITDSENLKFEEKQEIESYNINFNIKEPRLYEYREDGRSFIYSRFIDEFFEVSKHRDHLDYILDNAKSNNFVYLVAPRKVEEFAKLLAENINENSQIELEKLSKIISKNVHEDFYAVDLVKKGIIYLHGKLPDLVKEYLEFKFRETTSLHFIVANKVILEGVNLPIDNLYILNTYGLGGKGLVNLIGRVNRLNEVFNIESQDLNKLLPSIHFINSEFSRKNSSMSTAMRKLKSGVFKDEIRNPILLKFDFESIENTIANSTSVKTVQEAHDRKLHALKLRKREDFLIFDSQQENNKIKAAFIEAGIDSAYSDSELVIDEVSRRANIAKEEGGWNDLDVIEKVHTIFIDNLEHHILDLAFVRLKNPKARNFYRSFVRNTHVLNLKEHINETVRYFYTISDKASGKKFYIGSSYGELTKDENSLHLSYINLSTKSHKELVNLALVKIKMESDFVSYKLNEYVSFLKEINLIDENEYNLFIYGTSKKLNSDFTKLGLSGTLISKLERDGQLDNIQVNELGHVRVNKAFKGYLSRQDDLIQFEVNKYIDLSA